MGKKLSRGNKLRKKYKILDLFAGAGGLSLGFEMFRDSKGNKPYEIFKCVEIDPHACQTLRQNHDPSCVIEGDLTNKKIRNQVIHECAGKVDIIVGGIPCQSFSLLGPRSGHGKKSENFLKDKRDDLYREFLKIVKEINPKLLVIENVKGILSKKDSKGKLILSKIFRDFEKLGYKFENKDGQKYSLLNSANFGVPQLRERVILVGINSTWKQQLIPDFENTHFDPESDVEAPKGKLPYVTVYDAIGDLPVVHAHTTKTDLSDKQWAHYQSKNNRLFKGSDIIDVCKKTKKDHKSKICKSGKKYHKFIGSNRVRKIRDHVARPHQRSDLQLFEQMQPGETSKDFVQRAPKAASRLIKYSMDSFLDKYRRQHHSRPSSTVFAHMSKDGNRFIHPWQVRTYTPREAARIQSFPDNYRFFGTKVKIYRQIGNAVPPLLSYNIAKNLSKLLD